MQGLVTALYEAHDPARADWADWLGEHHVFLVADYATDLARRFGADEELARAGGLLHDIADTKMSRFADNHEETSLAMARELMQQAGFNDDEVRRTADDAIRFHSCHDGRVPEGLEGKVLATADAKAHLLSDFYLFAAWAMGKEGKTLDEVKQYVLKKIDRDFNDKIIFDEVRAECTVAYNALKTVFSS
jgi:putative nucleotidyltransferase with HDIG domain